MTSALEKKKPGRPSDIAKRDAIVDAASRRFFDEGFAATSIEQVAADAGVSKVTIYNHFGDKRGLFAAAVGCECEKMRGHFSLEGMPAGSIRERLMAIATAMFAFLSRPEMVQFERRIAAETEHDPAIGEAFLAAGPWRMKAAFASASALTSCFRVSPVRSMAPKAVHSTKATTAAAPRFAAAAKTKPSTSIAIKLTKRTKPIVGNGGSMVIA